MRTNDLKPPCPTPENSNVYIPNTISTTCYLYDREDRIGDYDPSGNIITAYTHGPGIDEPVAMTFNNSTYFYIPDIQGSIRAIISADNGSLAAYYTYDVWGTLVSYGGSLAEKNDYLYTGREYDWQTGIYYYRARYYNPELGRFLQSSWEHTKEMNMYVYVGNNPVNEVDPSGHPFTPPPLMDHGGGCQFFSYQCKDPLMKQAAMDKCGQCPPPLECWCPPPVPRTPYLGSTDCQGGCDKTCIQVANILCAGGWLVTGIGWTSLIERLGKKAGEIALSLSFAIRVSTCGVGACVLCASIGLCGPQYRSRYISKVSTL